MTPRERFVEAMREIVDEWNTDNNFIPCQAIDAFADEECDEHHYESSWSAEGKARLDALHAACRATLRKECGIE
jgi:hypothetical protein